MFAKRHTWLTIGFFLGWEMYKHILPYLHYVDEWFGMEAMVTHHKLALLFFHKAGLLVVAVICVHLFGIIASSLLRFIILPSLDQIARNYMAKRAQRHAGDTQGII